MSSEEAGHRAVESFRALMSARLHSARRHLFGSRRWLIRRRYEDLWPFADAWSATCTLSSLATSSPPATSSLPSFFDGLASYHRSHGSALDGSGPVGFESVVVPPLGSGGDVFFDDNTWLGLALIRQHVQCDDQRALALARRLFEFVVSGWSSDPSWSHPGGVRWKEPSSCVSRNTCSNAPVAQLAALVSTCGEDPAALEWSVRIYQWVRSCLIGPDALYFDRIAPDGTIGRELWTYNQGTMIGAGVLLHEITGEEDYLAQATQTAAAALGHFSLPMLVAKNGPAFNAVYFRNLLLLDRLAPDPRYRQTALAYADEMWTTRRDSRTGLFTGDMSPLNESAPMVEIYALLAGAEPHA